MEKLTPATRARLVERIKKAARRLKQDPEKFSREAEVMERLTKALNGN